MRLVDLLDMAAAGDDSRAALGRRAEFQTYGQIRRAAARAAQLVTSEQAASLVMVAPNNDSVPALLFGADLAGVPFAPLNYRLADHSLRSLVERAGSALVVAQDGVAERLGPIPGTRFVSVDAVRVELSTTADGDAPRGEEDDDDVAIRLFTSGTTGTPKAAVLRHRHLVSYVLSNIEFMSAGPAEAALVSVPPYHIAGMMGVISSVYAGRRIVYLPSFTPRSWVELAGEEAVTHAMVVPTMLGRILDVLERTGPAVPELRHLAYGGGRMPRAVIERALRLLPHVDFVNAYGLTETSSTITVLGPEDHRAAVADPDPAVRNRLGSAGRPLPGVEVEVRSDAGRSLPRGEAGEIWARGDYIAGEYSGQRDLTADGWFRTRDRGWLDEAGYLYLDGRLDDVIVRGGENISPAEIEDALLEDAEVADAAVFGIPDDDWGEAVAAAVVLREGSTLGPEEIKRRVRQHVRSSRTPSSVFVVRELPYSDTGKLLRRALRDGARSGSIQRDGDNGG